MSKRLRLLVVVAGALVALAALEVGNAGAAVRFSADWLPSQVTATGSTHYSGLELFAPGSCQESLASPSTNVETREVIEFEPTYTECQSIGGDPMVVTTNGCKIAWSGASESVLLSCPSGKELVIQTHEKQGSQTICEYVFPSQTLISHASIVNQGSGSSSSIKVQGLGTYVGTARIAFPHECGAAKEGGPARLAFESSTTAISTGAGARQGIVAGHGGIYMAGKASEVPGERPHFENEWPSQISRFRGEQSSTNKTNLKFGTGIREISCSTANYNGVIGTAATELWVNPEFSNCTAKPGSLPVTFNPRNCSFTTTAMNVGPPYAASWGIHCFSPTAGIEAVVYENATKQQEGVPLCGYKIGPQEGLEGVSLINTGYGAIRAVESIQNVKGATASVVSGSKILCGNTVGGSVAVTVTGSYGISASY